MEKTVLAARGNGDDKRVADWGGTVVFRFILIKKKTRRGGRRINQKKSKRDKKKRSIKKRDRKEGATTG